MVDKRYIAIDPTTKEKIFNEVRAQRLMKHPNLVDFYEIHEDKKSIFIILEYIKGPSLLLSHALGQLIPENEIKIVLKSALRALKHIHDLGILHRDIKPDNFILKNPGKITKENTIKLVGFSDCMFYRLRNFLSFPSKCGTIGFVAPEIFKLEIEGGEGKGGNTPKRDIWSLGAVIYYLATKTYLNFNLK